MIFVRKSSGCVKRYYHNFSPDIGTLCAINFAMYCKKKEKNLWTTNATKVQTYMLNKMYTFRTMRWIFVIGLVLMNIYCYFKVSAHRLVFSLYQIFFVILLFIQMLDVTISGKILLSF